MQCSTSAHHHHHTSSLSPLPSPSSSLPYLLPSSLPPLPLPSPLSSSPSSPHTTTHTQPDTTTHTQPYTHNHTLNPPSLPPLQPHPHPSSHQAQPGCVSFFCETKVGRNPVVDMSLHGELAGAARRQRERRMRSFWRHEQQGSRRVRRPTRPGDCHQDRRGGARGKVLRANGDRSLLLFQCVVRGQTVWLSREGIW